MPFAIAHALRRRTTQTAARWLISKAKRGRRSFGVRPVKSTIRKDTNGRLRIAKFLLEGKYPHHPDLSGDLVHLLFWHGHYSASHAVRHYGGRGRSRFLDGTEWIHVYFHHIDLRLCIHHEPLGSQARRGRIRKPKWINSRLTLFSLAQPSPYT